MNNYNKTIQDISITNINKPQTFMLLDKGRLKSFNFVITLQSMYIRIVQPFLLY